MYFSFKFIQCRFYIWKITKTKFLNLVSKKGYPNFEYDQTMEKITNIYKYNHLFLHDA